MDELVILEQFITQLEDDYEHATYRHNEIVKDCIEKAGDRLETAFKKLAAQNFKKAYQMIRVSWLYANHARQLFDTEAFEHFLGDSDYLELTDEGEDSGWKNAVMADLVKLDDELKKVRSEIQRKVQEMNHGHV